MSTERSAFLEIEQRLRLLERPVLDVHQSRAELAARLEHALWSPLQCLRTATGQLAESPLTPEQREQASLAAAAGQMLQGLLNVHLDLAAEHAPRAIERATLELQDALAPVLKAVAPRAWRRGLALTFGFDADLPPALLGDPARLRRALLLLLEEGLRAPAGERLHLEVALETSEDHQALVRFALEGLADDAACAGGLAACDRLARELDGRLRLEPATDERPARAAFVARFERLPERRRRRRGAAAASRTLGFLLIEPDEATRTSRAADLAVRGLHVTSAASLHEALATLRASQADVHVALIEAGAWEQDDKVREELARALPGAALLLSTRHAGRALRETDRALGVRELLVEPLLPREAIVSIGRWTEASGLLEDTGFGARRPASVGALDVLLAEPNPAQRAHATTQLERLGHRVHVAPDGIAAVSRLHQDVFDLALLDLELPALDAPSLARLQRAREARSGGRLTLVALCAEDLEGQGVELREAGLDAWLTKPLRADELAWMLRRLFPPAESPAA